MPIKHLLASCMFRNIFNNPDFVELNVIASEIEQVIATLSSQSLGKHEFQQTL